MKFFSIQHINGKFTYPRLGSFRPDYPIQQVNEEMIYPYSEMLRQNLSIKQVNKENTPNTKIWDSDIFFFSIQQVNSKMTPLLFPKIQKLWTE